MFIGVGFFNQFPITTTTVTVTAINIVMIIVMKIVMIISADRGCRLRVGVCKRFRVWKTGVYGVCCGRSKRAQSRTLTLEDQSDLALERLG